MGKREKFWHTLALVPGLVAVAVMLALFDGARADDAMANNDAGKAIAMDRGRGNCIACHAMADGELPGTIGPPLVAMAARYPDKTALRARIWDATSVNPDSRMPPFGRHRLLTEEEIDLVTEYIYSL